MFLNDRDKRKGLNQFTLTYFVKLLETALQDEQDDLSMLALQSLINDELRLKAIHKQGYVDGIRDVIELCNNIIANQKEDNNVTSK